MTDRSREIRSFVLGQITERMKLLDLAPTEVDGSLNLVESGLLDSMGFVELVGSVENKFQVEINFEDLEPSEFTTLEGFVRCAVASPRAA
jgi:acyl carrier protein